MDEKRKRGRDRVCSKPWSARRKTYREEEGGGAIAYRVENMADLPPVPFSWDGNTGVEPEGSVVRPHFGGLSTGSGFIPHAPVSKTGRAKGLGEKGRGAVYSGLGGIGYTLKGNSTRFLLPQTDVYTGADIGLVASTASASAPKPKFLKEVEQFIASELRALGLSQEPTEPSAARLQVFREAFQYVIDDFKTYKPVLSAIKNEYDLLLDKYAKRLHFIPPLKARLSTAQADVQQRIQRMQEQHDREHSRLSEIKEALSKSNDEMKLLNKHLTDDNLKLTKELDEQRARYLDMKTANLSLVESVKSKDGKIADERLKSSRLEDRAKYLALQVEQAEMKYDTALAEMKKLRGELAELQAIQKEPEITPAQLLAVQKDLKKARDDMDKGGKAFQKLQKDHANLLVFADEAAASKKKLEEELAEARVKAANAIASEFLVRRVMNANVELPFVHMPTAMAARNLAAAAEGEDPPPRVPQRTVKECLMACLDHIDHLGTEDEVRSSSAEFATLDGLEGGDDNVQPGSRFNHLDDVEVVEKKKDVNAETAALAATSGVTGRARDANSYFEGRGCTEDVPLYLRINGRVKNLFLRKREVEQFIKTAWIQKGRKRYTKSLEEFLYVYLCEIYPKSPAERIEFAYSLMFALEKYSYDADCDLFLQVLHKKLPEEVYLAQSRLIRSIQEQCIREDRKDGEQSGRLRKVQILDIVRKLCPTKEQSSFREIEQALFFDTQVNSVDYIKLFQEDEEGDQGKFVECLRDQFLDECFAFREDIRSSLDVLRMTATDAGKPVSVSDIRRAFIVMAPEKTPEEISEYISRGCAGKNTVDIDPEAMNTAMDADEVDVDNFFERLQAGLLHR